MTRTSALAPDTWRHALRITVCAGMVALIAACGSSPRAPVENRSTGGIVRVDPATLPGYEFRNQPGYYSVQPGDTIYGIARTHGRSPLDIMSWNTAWVPNPNLIEVGQVLRVDPPAGSAPVVTSTPRRPAATTAPRRPSATSTATAAAGEIALSWPTQSRSIVTPFDSVKNKGIGIGGKQGDPVMAAADGQVIYAGSGLRGYGNLAIVQHNKTYLTVYAHNSKLLVRENQNVKKGQTIAEMGNTDADRVKLHFEVRRNGQSVNPTSYLR